MPDQISFRCSSPLGLKLLSRNAALFRQVREFVEGFHAPPGGLRAIPPFDAHIAMVSHGCDRTGSMHVTVTDVELTL
jgi:hypothetical protein